MNVLVTGSRGFIGSALVAQLEAEGHNVSRFDILAGQDLRSWEDVKAAIKGRKLAAVFHLAAQTAVTKSIQDPSYDMETNAVGTFRLLEAIRCYSSVTKFVYISTNKVYGEHVRCPVSEIHPISLETPYGCSKGMGDQYTLDYGRTYDLRTVVLRQSCIYGPGQIGTEDQGWIGYFTRKIIAGESIKIFGDGGQERDILYIDDLVDLYMSVLSQEACGVYNVGGGPENVVSLMTAAMLIKENVYSESKNLGVEWFEPRPSDQTRYVSDITKVCKTFHWKPWVGVTQGIRSMVEWAKDYYEGAA